MKVEPTVFIVDDDRDILESCRELLRSVQHQVSVFESGSEFLERVHIDSPGCVVCDVRMPGISGVELHNRVSARGGLLPFVFLTGYADVQTAVRAMANGAVDFLQKPFEPLRLLDRVHDALLLNARKRQQRAERLRFEKRLTALTPKEREVVGLVVAGKTTKEIAHDRRVSIQAIDAHRSRGMSKLGADTVAGLTRLVLAAAPDAFPSGGVEHFNKHIG